MPKILPAEVFIGSASTPGPLGSDMRAFHDSIETSLISLPKAMAIADCSKSHIYNLIKRGKFPPPVLRCGPRFTRWRASDILAWASDPQAYIDANEVQS